MDLIEFHSHEQQDEFVYNLFAKKSNGFFLEISCGHPIIGSNSYSLEKFCDWQGYCFDIGDCLNLFEWPKHRRAPFVQLDATSPALTNFLKESISTSSIVDYISLDVDAAGTNLALPTLKRVIESGIRFRAMTFEHERYLHGPNIQDQVNDILRSQDYIPLFSDVRLWSGGASDDSQACFEDWWIDPSHFDPNLIDIASKGLYYFECVDIIKNFMNNQYHGTHNCSQAWPEQYRLFWHAQEQQQLTALFSRMTKRK